MVGESRLTSTTLVRFVSSVLDPIEEPFDRIVVDSATKPTLD